MKMTFFVFVLLTAQAGIAQKDTLPGPALKAVEVRSFGVVRGESVARIFFVDDLIVYQTPYRHQQSSFTADDTTEQGVATVEKSETRHRYFVFQRDSSHGYEFDPWQPSRVKRAAVKIAGERAFGTNTFENLLQRRSDSTVWAADHSTLREVYLLPGCDSLPDMRVSLTYARLQPPLPHSLNKALDSAKSMQLVAVRLDWPAFYDKRQQQQWPPLYDLTEMTEVTIAEPADLRASLAFYALCSGRQR